MLPERIVRDDRVARLLPGAASVREFAAREFPREDAHWVAATTRPTGADRPRRVGLRVRLGRLWGTREAEPDVEPTSESTPA
jgi:hypothetical protein